MLLTEAFEAYAAWADRPGDDAKLEQLRKGVALAKRRGGPKELSIQTPFVESDAVWKATPGGYTLSKTLQIGNQTNEKRGGDLKAATVTAEPGFVLSGGTVRVSNGALKLMGTKDKPVVLRGVSIECDFTGKLEAAWTLFENCTFQKSGRWYWNGGFSSKWTLEDCLLVRSNFTALKRIDYGLRWRRTAFARCVLPPRDLGSGPDRKNAAGEYRASWNEIRDCSFVECDLPPSVLWGAVGTTRLDGCRAGAAGEYTGDKPLDVALSLGRGEEGLLKDLETGTHAKNGAAKVTYRQTTGRAEPPTSPLWRLAGPAAE